MASDGSLNFDTRLDESGFIKGVKNISKSVKGLASTLKGLGVVMAGFLATSVVKGMVNIANQAIELSSDMQEVQNVVDTAFGSMSYKAEEFAEVAIDQFGMSRLAAKQTASTYMAMGKSMGLSMEAASDMAIETAKLTGDVASFYNLSQDLAATKLKGIWSGETEGLKDLGVVMTEANLQQFALNKGITKSLSAMSQAEKVTLRYEYVMETLADAQGDFAKTSDSWANQTRVLSERWKELLAIIGGGLIRVLTPVITVINTIMAALVNLANAFASTVGQLFGWNKQMKITGSSGAAAAEGQEELADATAAAGEAAAGSLASFDKLDVLQQNTGSGAAAGMGEMEVIGAEPLEDNGNVIDKMSERIQRLQPYVDRLRESWERLKTAFENFWNSPGVKHIREFLYDFWLLISERLAAMFLLEFAALLDILSGAFDFLGGTLRVIVGILNGDMEMAGQGFKQMLSGLKSVLSAFGKMLESVLVWILGIDAVEAMKWWIKQAGEWVKKTKIFTGDIRNAFEGLIKFLKGIFTNDLETAGEGFKQMVSSMEKALINFGEWIEEVLISILGKESVESIKDWLKQAKEWLTKTDGYVSNVKNIFEGLIKFIKGVFTADWKTAWNGVTQIFKGIWNNIVSIVESAVNLIIRAINWWINQLNRLYVDVPDWVTELTGMYGFGFNIRPLSGVSIPRLATGAVIPPNAEFMAILGDQKHGNNIEAPEALIRQIVREESGSGNIVINAKGTMGQLIRLLKLEIEKEDNRSGGSFVTGGA